MGHTSYNGVVHFRRPNVVTESEFLSLPESMERTELIDGEVIVAPAPPVLHQEILSRIVYRLRTWARAQSEPVYVGQSPIDVRLAADRIVQPDAFVVLGAVPLDHQGPLDLTPDLCVEVLSGNRIHDRVTKRFLYGAAGVREYWLVDPQGVVERCTGPELTMVEVVEDTLASDLLPGLSIQIAELVAG